MVQYPIRQFSIEKQDLEKKKKSDEKNHQYY